MMIYEDLHDGYVKIYSDRGRKLVTDRNDVEYSEAIVKYDSVAAFHEKAEDESAAECQRD